MVCAQSLITLSRIGAEVSLHKLGERDEKVLKFANVQFSSTIFIALIYGLFLLTFRNQLIGFLS